MSLLKTLRKQEVKQKKRGKLENKEILRVDSACPILARTFRTGASKSTKEGLGAGVVIIIALYTPFSLRF
jgi:hypothetical protein